jgi:hypothetical protein
VTDLPFSTNLATFDGSGECMTSPNIWYCYTATCTGIAEVSLCGSYYDTKLAVYDGCGCAPVGLMLACNDDACGGPNQSEVYFPVVEGNSYLIEVGGWDVSIGFGVLSTSCYVPPPNDLCTGAPIINTFPTTVYGTTKGATFDCPDAPYAWDKMYAVWYQLDLPYSLNKVIVDYCPSPGQMGDCGRVMYSSCPSTPDCPDWIDPSTLNPEYIQCTDFSWRPKIWWSGLSQGSYWLPVLFRDWAWNPFVDFGITFTVEEVFPPANDNCANAEALAGDVTDLPFSTEGAYFDGPGVFMTSPNIWYCYTATCTGVAHISLCGSNYDTKLAVYDGCSCEPIGAMLASNDQACEGSNYGSEVYIPVVQGNSYLIEVGGYGHCSGTGLLSTSCGPPQPNDECTGAVVINTFPQTVYGTTKYATVDCPSVMGWNAVWYRFDVPYPYNNVSVDFCAWETYGIWEIGVVLYDECDPDCPNYIAAASSQWAECPGGFWNPQIKWTYLPGPASYWFPVYLGMPYDFGFTVSVDSSGPCDMVCPPGAMLEGEPTCYDGYIDNNNGGCNWETSIFQNIGCNTTICGTSGVYWFGSDKYRDTDWFRVKTVDGVLTFSCVAEFPVQIILYDAGLEDCISYMYLDGQQAAKCDTATISTWVPAGVYWLWVGPKDWENYPCGGEYVAKLECTPRVTCGDVTNDDIVDVDDVVYLIDYLYRDGLAPVPYTCVGDVNNNDIVNLGDVVYLINYVYKDGPAPDPNCYNPPGGCK